MSCVLVIPISRASYTKINVENMRKHLEIVSCSKNHRASIPTRFQRSFQHSHSSTTHVYSAFQFETFVSSTRVDLLFFDQTWKSKYKGHGKGIKVVPIWTCHDGRPVSSTYTFLYGKHFRIRNHKSWTPPDIRRILNTSGHCILANVEEASSLSRFLSNTKRSSCHFEVSPFW